MLDPGRRGGAGGAAADRAPGTTRLDAWRSWKGVDWNATDRLYEKGYISDPKSKAKSVMLTHAGFERGRALLRELCGRDGD
ncbi:MAG: DUF6429 family protein [Rhodovibrio sp.]|nr:DUF6429 family protein [Rhodovibrio sp.]